VQNKKRHTDRSGWLGDGGLRFGFGLVLGLIQALAHPELAAAQTSEVTVTGTRDADVQPIMQIDPEDLQSYGTDSMQNLLDALGPRIQSSMSNSPPVVLINGRLAGTTELQNLPPEAIARVDVLPEKAALRYGFPDDRRVVNLVLREHFRIYIAQAADSQSTQGGGQTASGNTSTTHIDHDTQTTVRADYKESEQLLESQRDISSPDSDARTLEPTLHDTKLAASFVRDLFGLRPSLEASVDSQATDSLQGLAATDSGEDQLRQRKTTTTAHIAARVNGMAGELNWTAAASYDQTNTITGGATGVDAAGGLSFLDAHSKLDNVAVDGAVGGPFLQLPAGRAFVSANLNAHLEDFDTATEVTDTPAASAQLSRTNVRLRVFTNFPLTSRSAGVWPALGDLAVRLNFSEQEVSNFGALTSSGFGVNWIPVKPLNFNAAFNTTRTAPSVQNLLDPTVITPDVQTFDFVTDETTYVTTITGGNPDLRNAETQGTTVGLYVDPFEGRYTFRATYQRLHTLDGIGGLPPASEAVELAFPDRFVRDSDGNLIEIDTRPVNLALAEKDFVIYGFTLIPFNGPPSPKAPPAPRLVITLFDTWYLRDTLLVRQGVPELDLLNGAPTSATTGSVATTQARHALDLRANYMYRGLGVEARTAWHSATEVDGGTAATASTLYFSALTTTNLRLFASLGDFPLTKQHPWAKGLRVDLLATNILNAHQKVQDATGATPVGFEPGYIDPLGRVVMLAIRKAF
jgi:hypothetical protein